MFDASLNGLTLAELAAKIQETPTGFSIAEDVVYYQGRPLELSSGKTLLAGDSEPEGSTGARRDLYTWLTSMLPKTRQKLISPQASVERQEAAALTASHVPEAVEQVSVPKLTIAEALEHIGTDYQRIDDLENLNTLTPKEKFQLLQTLQQNSATPLHGFDRGVLEDIEPVDVFELIEDSLNYSCPDAASEGFSRPLFLRVFGNGPDQKGLLSKDLPLMHQVIGDVRDDMAAVLNNAVDEILEKFRVHTTRNNVPSSMQRGDYPIHHLHEKDYFHRTNHVLYLTAACGYFSDVADISDSLSYLTEALALPQETDLKWVATDLLFHLRNPDAVNDYSRYFATVTDLLSREDSVEDKCRMLAQLTAIVQIRLNQSSERQSSFFSALEGFVTSQCPEYCATLLATFNNLLQSTLPAQTEDSTIEADQQTLDPQVLNQRIVHLLLLSSATSSVQHPVEPDLVPFLKVAMDSDTAFSSLFNGWSSLIESSPETQDLFVQSAREDDYLLSALMGLPQLHHSQIISDSTLAESCNNLLASFASSTPMTSPAVLKRWLDTLKEMGSYQSQTGINLEQAIITLTGNMSELETKLRFMDALMDTSPDKAKYLGIQSVLKLLGFGDCPGEDAVATALEDVASGFTQNQNLVCHWLWAQRQPHILALYLQGIVTENDFQYCDGVLPDQQGALKEELIELIHEYAQTSATNTFITTRNCTTNNPHLAAVYQQRPDLAGGWGANFHGFSDAVLSHLGNGDSLELTEDPWDLFIASEEVQDVKAPTRKKGAQSPAALMSDTMDGSYALIARKDPQGVILRKALVRLVLADSMKSPALAVEEAFPWSSRDQAVFVMAASELARQMDLPLFKQERSSKENLKTLEGRAPFECFGKEYVHARSEGNITAQPVILL